MATRTTGLTLGLYITHPSGCAFEHDEWPPDGSTVRRGEPVWQLSRAPRYELSERCDTCRL